MINGIKLLQAAETAAQSVTEAAEKPDLIPAEHTDLMWSTLVTGLVVVFLILIILVLFLWILGKVMSVKNKPKKTKTAAQSAKTDDAVQQAAPAAEQNEGEEEYEEDDSEIIAVISAAIAAYGEAEGKQYRIASVKRREKALRSNWAAAGIAENTKPF